MAKLPAGERASNSGKILNMIVYNDAIDENASEVGLPRCHPKSLYAQETASYSDIVHSFKLRVKPFEENLSIAAQMLSHSANYFFP